MPSMQGEIANLIVQLSLDDSRFTGRVNAASGALRRMGPGLAQVSRGTGQAAAGLARVGTVAAAAAVGGLAAVITTAASFEQAWAGVEKTTGLAGEASAALRDEFEELSRTIPLTFEELAAIGEAGGALGIATADLDEFTDTVARLSVSTNLSSEEAATALGQLGNILHLNSEDLHDFADSLVALGNAGASTEAEIVAIAARFGAAGNAAGLSAEEILGFSSAAASLAIEPEAAGGALSRLFNNITTDIGTASDEAVTLGQSLGLSLSEFQTAWDRDAGATFRDLLGAIHEMDQFEAAAFLSDIGITNSRDINAIRLMADNLGLVNEQIGISVDQTDELNRESQAFFDTTEGKWQIFKNNIALVADQIGAELLPVVNEVMDEFVTWLRDPAVQAGIKQFAEDLAGGIRSFVEEIRGADFGQLISLFQGAAGIAKTAFDAFRSLPGPIQQLILAAVVANKVTGGGISMIAQGIGNILAGTIRVAFAGALGGLNLGGGRVGGALSRILAQPVFVTNWPPGSLVPGGPGGGAGGRAGGKFPFVPVAAAIAIPMAISGSNTNTDVQIQMLLQKLNSGKTWEEASSGITRGALEAISQAPDLQAQLNPAALAKLEGGLASIGIGIDTGNVQQLSLGDRIALALGKNYDAVNKSGSDAATRLALLAAKTSEVRNSTDRLLPNTAMVANNTRTLPSLPPIMQSVKGGLDGVRGGISLTTLAVNQSVGKLGIIAAKNFSPTVRVTTNPVVKISNTIIANGVAQVKSFTFGVGVGAPRPV